MVDARFSIPKLNGQNWQTWKVRVEMLLCREDLWYVVEDGVPDEDDRSDNWKKDDRKAKATIVLLLDDCQLPLVKNCAFASDVYNSLKAYHQKTSRSVRVSLLKKLCSVNLSEGGNLERHLSEVDELIDRLDAAGTELDKDTKICMLLRSLPPSFDAIVSALDGRSDDDISMDVVKSKLTDEYFRRLERDGSSVETEKAMRSSEGKIGKDSRTCYFCKLPGHLRRNCRKFLEAQKAERSEEEDKAKTAHGFGREVAFTLEEDMNPSAWVIDSGASTHMTGDRSFFGKLQEFAGGWITMANGVKTQIRGEGCGVLDSVGDDGEKVKIKMSDVKYVPGLTTNLISVRRLTEKNLKVVFEKDLCKICDGNGIVVATGARIGGLYQLCRGPTPWSGSDSHRAKWRRRIGHCSMMAVQRSPEEELTSGIKRGPTEEVLREESGQANEVMQHFGGHEEVLKQEEATLAGGSKHEALEDLKVESWKRHKQEFFDKRAVFYGKCRSLPEIHRDHRKQAGVNLRRRQRNSRDFGVSGKGRNIEEECGNTIVTPFW